MTQRLDPADPVLESQYCRLVADSIDAVLFRHPDGRVSLWRRTDERANFRDQNRRTVSLPRVITRSIHH